MGDCRLVDGTRGPLMTSTINKWKELCILTSSGRVVQAGKGGFLPWRNDDSSHFRATRRAVRMGQRTEG